VTLEDLEAIDCSLTGIGRAQPRAQKKRAEQSGGAV